MVKKRRKSRRAVHYLEYAGLKMMETVFRILPLQALYLCAEAVGRIGFHVIRIRRAVTMDNLRNALGTGYNEEELRKIAARTYVNMGESFLEMLAIRKFTGRIFDFVDFPDADVMRQALKRGKGAILVSCHMGNWEINGIAVAATGIPINVVVKRQSNPFVDRYVNRNREFIGLRVITLGSEIKYIIRALRNNEVIGLISDQDAGKKGVFVDFFGKKASTPKGAAHLALKYHAPMLITIAVRTGNGSYRCILEEVPIEDGDTVETVTQRYTHILEDIIRKYPDQYFWMHRRWKTPPPSGQDINDE